MNRLFIVLTVNIILISISNRLISQDFKPGTKEDVVKSYFWGTSAIKSTDVEIPEKWKNESAVFLSKKVEHRVYNVVFPSKLFVSVFLYHSIIKLQDKAAVEKFSTFYKDNYKVGNPLYFWHNIYYAFKLIKPDGTEKIINTKEEVVTDAGSSSKRDKIAIPGLEVGDILDFYWYSYDYLRGKEVYLPNFINYPVVNYYMNLQDEYPVLDLNLCIKTNKNWRVELGSYNGASEFTKKVIDKKKYEFTLSVKNVEKLEKVIWSYPLITNPTIKSYVFYEKNFQKKNLKLNSNYSVSNLDRNKIIKTYKGHFNPLKSAANEYESFKKYLNKHEKSNISDEKKVEELYYFFRHIFLNKHLIHDKFNNNNYRYTMDKAYVGHIFWSLSKMKIPYDMLFVLPRHYGSVDNMLNIGECDNILLKANCKSPLFMYKPDNYALFNALPYTVEGTKAIRLSPIDGNVYKLKIDEINLPTSNYNSNVTEYNYSFKLNADNPNVLNLKGKLSAYGHNADDYKESLVTPFDYVFNENDIYETKRWGDIENIKNQNQVEKINQFQADLEKERKENLIETLNNSLTVKPENVEYKLISAGNWIGDSIISIDFSCTLEGLITNAGNNYILNVGKFIGDQVTIDEKSINRKSDIYMNYPRSFQYNIDFELPDGYKLSGIDKLDISVQNETGGFECKPFYMDNILSLKIKKYYKHNFEPLKNWQLMLDFLKAANDFTEQKVLISK